ncbi:MAG: hypothetical protein EOM22_08790 [Gammaproteobacteria bacterium]|nr:hypothetical protein [Gammaproteobacteria bacterium]
MSESNRAQIASEILDAIDASDRPITLSEMYEASPSAEDRASVARVASYLKSTKAIEVAGEIQPGEPGGMAGKGARTVASYRRVPGNVERSDSAGELGFFSKTTAAEIGQGTSADIIALGKMSAAEDDDEARFDDELEWARGANSRAAAYQAEAAADSHGGDEFDENAIAILIHGHEEMMLTYADGQLGGDKVWSLMRQQYQALQEL